METPRIALRQWIEGALGKFWQQDREQAIMSKERGAFIAPSAPKVLPKVARESHLDPTGEAAQNRVYRFANRNNSNTLNGSKIVFQVRHEENHVQHQDSLPKVLRLFLGRLCEYRHLHHSIHANARTSGNFASHSALVDCGYSRFRRILFASTADEKETKKTRIPSLVALLCCEFAIRSLSFAEPAAATQSPKSVAIPKEDLQVRLADSRSAEDRRTKPPMVRLDVTNSGREAFFYTDRPYPRGIELQVADDKGRALSLNERGKELALDTTEAPRKSAPVSEPRPRSIEFLSGQTKSFCELNLDAFTLLAPNSAISVRVVWTGNVYRSAQDRDTGKNPLPFEIRSNTISVRTPRD
jgi:hypothetical protein